MNSTGRFTPALRRLTHYRYDHCSQCNAALPVGKASFAGYNSAQKEIYVGDCCQSQIKELASHIYWWWTNFKRPQWDTVIWRYMDFSKFLAMINDGALYFARADTLGDPFEGARGLASRKDEWKTHCVNYYKGAILSAPGRVVPPSQQEVELEAEKLYESMVEGGERELLNTYVSCWHANVGESEAQWRLYTPPQSAGIAIRTTMGKLDVSFDQIYDVRGGFVQYVDFKTTFAGTYDRIFWKRASLSHENEVRLVLANAPMGRDTPTGINVPLRMSEGFEAIIISPFAPSWVEGMIRKTLGRYELMIPVETSKLLEQPFF